MAKFIADLHTHTVANDHAFSTLFENILIAKEKGLKMIAMTDHGPRFIDSAMELHFMNEITAIPRVSRDVIILKGIETNFLPNGTTDCPKGLYKKLDIVIGNFHGHVFDDVLTKEQNTEIMLKIIKSKEIDIISHPADPNFPKDYEALVDACVKNDVALEINSSSGKNSRRGSYPECVKLAKIAHQKGALISIGSDSHYCDDVGNFKQSIDILTEAGISLEDEHIINNSEKRIVEFLDSKGHVNLGDLKELLGMN